MDRDEYMLSTHADGDTVDSLMGEHYISRISVLRELDSIIDFARGALQLRIVFELAKRDGGASARDIATALNERHKAVLDAFRKLVAKGLVIKEANGGMDIYRLSESGEEFYEKLARVMGLARISSQRLTRAERRVMVSDISTNTIKYHHLADAIIAIATSRGGELSIEDVASAMKLGIDRARTYIDMYVSKSSGVRLFKKIEKESRARRLLAKILGVFGFKIRAVKTLYRITEEGLSIFYRHPYYLKYRRSIAAKIIQRLFGCVHPRIAFKKLVKMVLIVVPIVLGVAVAQPQLALPILAPATAAIAILMLLLNRAI